MCEFLLARDYVVHLQRYGPEWKFLNLLVVREVLSAPAAIFEGLKRPDFAGGYAYSGRPATRTIRPGVEAPAQPGFVALVTVGHDHRGHTVLDWEMRKEDLARPGFPENWQADFEALAWPTN